MDPEPEPLFVPVDVEPLDPEPAVEPEVPVEIPEGDAAGAAAGVGGELGLERPVAVAEQHAHRARVAAVEIRGGKVGDPV